MQRLFSAFPDSLPGLGLLLLRIVVGVTAVLQGGTHLTTVANLTLGPCVVAGLAIASGAAVLIGFLTPFTGVALGLSVLLFWFPSPARGLFLDRMTALLIIADAIAIALLGPMMAVPAGGPSTWRLRAVSGGRSNGVQGA